jgi:hypothetical protein
VPGTIGVYVALPTLLVAYDLAHLFSSKPMNGCKSNLFGRPSHRAQKKSAP